MRFTENRKIAWCVLVLCIFVSIFVLGGMALARERGQAILLFEDGSDTGLSVRHSMDAYLDASAESAYIMISEAEIYSIDEILTETARTLASKITEGEDIGARYTAYSELKTKVEQLYNKMYNAAVGDNFTNFKIAYEDFWGYEDMIKRDDYHKTAREFNKMANGFPGRFIAHIIGQDALSTFGG